MRPMTLFTISGVVEAPGRSQTNVNVALQMLALALRERFDCVHASDHSVDAGVSGVMALTFRGRRTHPMLSYEKVRLELDSQNSRRLGFTLSFKMLIVASVYLALGSGLLASIDSGLAKGLATGVAFAAAFFLLNYVVSRHRAFKWLSSQWATALASSGSSTTQRS